MLYVSIYRDLQRTQYFTTDSKDTAAEVVAKFFDYLLHDGYRMICDSHAPLAWHFVHKEKDAYTIMIEREIYVVQ